MYSLHDITSVCPKLEPIASDERNCREEEHLRNHSDGQMNTFAAVSLDNNNTVTMTTAQLDQYKKMSSVDKRIHERTTTDNTSPYEMKSIGAIDQQVPDESYRTPGEIPDGQILNVYTAVPVYENGSHEVFYYSVSTPERGPDSPAGTRGTYGYDTVSYERIPSKQTVAPEGLSARQSSTYGTMPCDQVSPNREMQPYSMVNQEKTPRYQMNTHRGTHRALTSYEVGVEHAHSCSCTCHHPTTQATSHFPAFGLRNERPSVIMVPASWNGVMSDTTAKVNYVNINTSLAL